MANKKITLLRLALTGPRGLISELPLTSGLNLIYGASNTGKSFAFKAIDFMLGGKTELPEIKERRHYDRGWLSLNLPNDTQLTLMRPLAGGAYNAYSDLVSEAETKIPSFRLSSQHDGNSEGNLSNFLLSRLELSNKSIATSANGDKRSLSFRDLVHLCLVSETDIMSERSPIETGQPITRTAERSVFKLLLTGIDDNAITTNIKRATFQTTKSAKIEVLDELISNIDKELEADFPDVADLPNQISRLNDSIARASQELENARRQISEAYRQRDGIGKELRTKHARLGEINIHIDRFHQLDQVYSSDIARLEGLEEAGFVLSVGPDMPCPVCGADSKDQKHGNVKHEITDVRNAALAEVQKIRVQQKDLHAILLLLNDEVRSIGSAIQQDSSAVQELDNRIASYKPFEQDRIGHINELIRVRDNANHGIELTTRRVSLLEMKAQLSVVKYQKPEANPNLGVSNISAHTFAQEVLAVLKGWSFPNIQTVSFDEVNMDIRIDGTNRRDNGKGVRAVFHAAFTVALLIHCHKNNLPHPGFVILDTPLLTYRDPIKSEKGELSEDELLLKQSTVKENFFRHLSSLSEMGQIIVFENIDPPAQISKWANVQVFTGEQGLERYGFLNSLSS